MQKPAKHKPFVERKNAIFFDVDGTLKGVGGTPRELPLALQALKDEGWELGICTSRSPRLLKDFLVSFESGLRSFRLFDSWLVLEDGHVVVQPGRSLDDDPEVLTESNALSEMRIFEACFENAWCAAADEELAGEGWGYLMQLTCPAVKLTPPQWYPIGTVSIWERGPHVTSPDYRGQFERVMQWALEVAEKQRFHSITFNEVGNGTLCANQKDINKATGLLYTGIDLSGVIFVGDGYNDVPVAQLLREAGGIVIAVANAVSELKDIAHYVTKEPSSHGVLEFAQKLRRNRADYSSIPCFRRY